MANSLRIICREKSLLALSCTISSFAGRKWSEAPRRQSSMKQFAVLIFLLLATPVVFSQSAQPGKAQVEIPFEFVHNQIVVEVKVGGKGPFKMLVDTNTDPSAIDIATARELGLAVGDKGTPVSGGGTEANTAHLTRL